MENENLIKCPICGENPSESFQAKYLKVFKCGNPECDHLFASETKIGHGIQKHSNPEEEHEKYRERNKKLSQYWQKHGFIRADSKVLDIGAGSGHIALVIDSILC
jgi:hypothetical protein